MGEERVRVGYVGVDSGQVMICDPCYIEGQWKNEQFFDVREYVHKDGAKISFPNDFIRFDEVIEKYGKSMNDMIDAGEVKQVKPAEPEMYAFSYDGCCKATLSKKMAGQLKYKMGHAGAGVASSAGYGDGIYPVYVTYGGDGRVTRLEVVFVPRDDEIEAEDEAQARVDAGE